ncbi:MAG: peptide chain release factor N(5)-glutamine methyltransferase [Bacteroidia bacterium]
MYFSSVFICIAKVVYFCGMQIPSNKIADIKSFFVQSLSHLYDREEAASIFFIVIEHLLHITRNDYMLNKSATISESELLNIHFVLKDLKKGIPIQYILGETQFMGLKLKVNSAVLIPRPETEELVDWIIQSHKSEKINRIVDIGTGSGCIALAIKKHFFNTEVFALDISESVLQVAKENALINNVEINFQQIDILTDISIPNQIDIIVSNPPYVTRKEAESMHANVLEHEPHLALFVPDNDALLFYKRIIELAKENLLRSGWLYFEINQYLANEMKELFLQNNFKNVELKKDLSGNYRMIRGRYENL